MSKEVLESVTQTKILKYLKVRGGFAYKHCPDPVGMPDIQYIENGKAYWIEVKRSEKHKPTPIQKLRHEQLRAAGCKVKVAWNVEQVAKWLPKRRNDEE